MDQGLRDQNSETRNLSLADQTEPRNLANLTLKQPSETTKHGSSSQLEEASSNSPVTKVSKHGSSKEGPERVEMVSLSLKNTVNAQTSRIHAGKTPLEAYREVIENRLQSDSLKLEKIWERTSQAISKLKETPDSVEALRKAVGDLRSSFSDYELAWISLMDFTRHASLPEHQEERQTVEAMMRTRKELVQAAINEGLDRKNDLLLELGSFRSGSRASKSSVSLNTLRAHAKGEAAAALKRLKCKGKFPNFKPSPRWR